MTDRIDQPNDQANPRSSHCYDAPWIVGYLRPSQVNEFIRQVANRMVEPGVVTRVNGTREEQGRFRLEVWKQKAVTHMGHVGSDVHHQFYDSIDEREIRSYF